MVVKDHARYSIFFLAMLERVSERMPKEAKAELEDMEESATSIPTLRAAAELVQRYLSSCYAR